jgi:steroid 5-alpha reductase family enzyme
MRDSVQLWAWGQAAMVAWMVALAFVSHARRDGGWVDVGWTGGIALFAVWLAWGSGGSARAWAVAGLASFWSGRLVLYILRDRVLGREEDPRYRALREHWGERAPLYFFLGFVSQAFLITLFAIPLWAAMRASDSLSSPGFLAGVTLWGVSIVGEWIADLQLRRFRRDPANRGRTCRNGLWRYSRHPNYFFEWLHWWAYVAMAAGAPGWWTALLGPALMLLFLFKVTGIPFTERQALKSRGEDYRRYQRETSVFIPWFPRTIKHT